MRNGRSRKFSLQRIKRPADLVHTRCRSVSHGFQGVRVPAIVCEINQLVGVVLQVVQEFTVAVIEVANVFEPFVSEPFEGRDTSANGKVFMEGFCPPVRRLAGCNDGLQAVALISSGIVDARPVKKCGWQIKVQRQCISNLAALRFRTRGSATIRGTRSDSSNVTTSPPDPDYPCDNRCRRNRR